MSLENNPKLVLNLSVDDVTGADKHFYRFKSFRLDVEERQLLRHSSPVPLTPKAFDVLVTLVERSGHLVGKNELLESIWADAFVEEQNITRIVHTLRKVLGEDENGNKFIETVAKKGYRFVAKVTEVREEDKRQSAAAVGSQDDGDEELPTANRLLRTETTPLVAKPKPKTRIILFAVGFLSAVFLIFLLSFNFQSNSVKNPDKAKSIAVLPLKPIGAATRDEIYEVGIADSLILRLGAMKSFSIRPLSATRKYADIEQDPIAAGKELQVDYILASNYQIADGKIRVTSQLFNVASGQIEETYKTEKEAGNIFVLQDTIAGEVGNILLARFAATEGSPAAKRGTTNEEAYRLYLHGKNLTNQRTDEDSRKAVEYLEQAVRLDPNFARGYAGLALAYDFSGMTAKAKEAVEKALSLDSNLSEAFMVRGKINFSNEWNFDVGEKDLLRAIELEPNNDLAHWAYALLSAYRGRFDDALREIETALSIAPGTVMYQRDRGRILYYARRYDEAIVQFNRALETGEDFGSIWGHLWMAYEMNGNQRMAYETFIKWQKLQKNELLETFQKVYAAAGWQEVKRKILEFNKLTEHQPGTNFFALARQCARLGDKEQAFEYLNRSFEKHQLQMVMLNVEPQLDSLRDDPQFDELVRRVGLK